MCSRAIFSRCLAPMGQASPPLWALSVRWCKKPAVRFPFLALISIVTSPGRKYQLGVVPQEFNFNQFEKVIDIVLAQAGYYGMTRREALPRAEKLLTDLGLWDKRNGMRSMLSGGMKRRLMIARALIHRPKLLILDEPTAGVDIELRRSMWEYMRRINREEGTTIILTTHYLEEAESLCRNIAIINHGEIVKNTSVRELLGQLNTETFLLDTGRAGGEVPEVEGFPDRKDRPKPTGGWSIAARNSTMCSRQLPIRGSPWCRCATGPTGWKKCLSRWWKSHQRGGRRNESGGPRMICRGAVDPGRQGSANALPVSGRRRCCRRRLP